MDKDYINSIFTYHAPFGDQAKRYEIIRDQVKVLAHGINHYCPDSPEKTLAIRHLQQAVMWANASIAINEKDEKTA